MYNLNYINECYSKYRATKVDDRISPKETMYDKYYFIIGEDAMHNVALGCLAAKIGRVDRVLDLPCGHGRVLRHLVNFFPEAEFHACDLDVEGLQFCAETFGALPIRSVEELTDVAFPNNYDVIWVGSLFTHTARKTTNRWIAHLARFLSPHGIIVTTLHGRFSEQVQRLYPYIGEDRWSKIMQGYRATGHGYCDYVRAESHSYIEGSYGISVTKPHVTIEDVEEIPGTRIHLYLERGWAGHHDVLVLGKPPYDEKWPGM